MMENKCKNCDEKSACVPFFAHENVLMHYNRANRRMLIALAVVCVTFIVAIVVFVTSYTEREKNWLDMFQRAGVSDGIQQQSGP